jgi:hypothetical protein
VLSNGTNVYEFDPFVQCNDKTEEVERVLATMELEERDGFISQVQGENRTANEDAFQALEDKFKLCPANMDKKYLNSLRNLPQDVEIVEYFLPMVIIDPCLE